MTHTPNITKLHGSIFFAPNFFSDDELPVVRSAIRECPINPPRGKIAPYEIMAFSQLGEKWLEIFNHFADRLKSCVEHAFGASVQHRPFPGGTIFRAGDSQDQHVDMNFDFDQIEFGKYMISNDAFPYDYTSLLYLADDFTGGNLVFGDSNITIRPSFGNLVMFACWPPGVNRHGVEEVTSGVRVCGVTFWPQLKGTGGAQDQWIDFVRE